MRREAATQDANDLQGKWSFGFCRSGHNSLFHPRTLVCRSLRPFLPPPPPPPEDGRPSQTLLPFLERCPWLHPLGFVGRGGISPSLHLPPPLALSDAQFCTPSQGKNDCYIDQEVDALLSKGAIEEVPLFPPPPCYISSIFLVPKKSGGMRPILKLKRLNAAHLNTPYFCMETVEDVRYALQLGDWAASIDLRDAYFHVPLHHSTKKYMCFGWRGHLYCFCVLSFGVSPAPKVFTALTRFIKVHSWLGHRGRGGPQPSSPCFLFWGVRREGSLFIH
jgi:hypothetical protein